MLRLLAIAQGAYYLFTGIWPLINRDSFLAVTGPKTDLWLVNTVSVLVIVIGGTLLFGAAIRQVNATLIALAIGSAAGLVGIEFFYAMRGEIWPIYLLDAIGEAVLILLWAVALFRARALRGTPLPMSGWRSSHG